MTYKPEHRIRYNLTREQTRAHTATLLRLAVHRYSIPLLAQRLDITYDQVRRLCENAGIDTSRPQITRHLGRPRKPREPKGRPVVEKKPRVRKSRRKRVVGGSCGLCGNTDIPLTPGELLGPHKRLGPRNGRGVQIAVPCKGENEMPLELRHKTNEGAS